MEEHLISHSDTDVSPYLGQLIGDFVTTWISRLAGFSVGLILFPLTRPFLRMANQTRVLREKNASFWNNAEKQAKKSRITPNLLINDDDDDQEIKVVPPSPLNRFYVLAFFQVAIYDIFHVAILMPAYFVYEFAFGFVCAFDGLRHGLFYVLEEPYNSVHYSANYGGDFRHSADETVQNKTDYRNSKEVKLKEAKAGYPNKIYDSEQHFYFNRSDIIYTILIAGLISGGVFLGLHAFGLFHLLPFISQHLHLGTNLAAHTGSAVYSYLDSALVGFGVGMISTVVIIPVQYLAISALKGLALAFSTKSPRYDLKKFDTYSKAAHHLFNVLLTQEPEFSYEDPNENNNDGFSSNFDSLRCRRHPQDDNPNSIYMLDGRALQGNKST